MWWRNREKKTCSIHAYTAAASPRGGQPNEHQLKASLMIAKAKIDSLQEDLDDSKVVASVGVSYADYDKKLTRFIKAVSSIAELDALKVCVQTNVYNIAYAEQYHARKDLDLFLFELPPGSVDYGADDSQAKE